MFDVRRTCVVISTVGVSLACLACLKIPRHLHHPCIHPQAHSLTRSLWSFPLHRHGRDERGPVLCSTLPDAKQAPTRGLLRADCEDLAHDPLYSPPTTWTRTSLH